MIEVFEAFKTFVIAVFILAVQGINVLMNSYDKPIANFDNAPNYESLSEDNKYLFVMNTSLGGRVSGLYLRDTNQLIWPFQEDFAPGIVVINERFIVNYLEVAARTPALIGKYKVRKSLFSIYQGGKLTLQSTLSRFCDSQWAGDRLVEEQRVDYLNEQILIKMKCSDKWLKADLRKQAIYFAENT